MHLRAAPHTSVALYLQAGGVAELALAPALTMSLPDMAAFTVETCITMQQAARWGSRAGTPAGQALVAAAAVRSCGLLLTGMAEVLRTLPALPATAHQAEASLTQQALMLLGKVPARLPVLALVSCTYP